MILSYRDFKLGKNLYFYGQKKLIYVRFKYHGRDVRRCTGKRDLATAQKVAWEIYCEVAGLSEKKVALRRSNYATIEEVLELYKSNISSFGTCSLLSAKNNAKNLERILKISGVHLSSRLDTLNEEIINKWRAIRYREHGLDITKDDDLKLNYSLNSMLRQAKNVFSKNALKLYESKKIKIPPSIKNFCQVANLRQMSTTFEPIPELVDQKIKGITEDVLNGVDNREITKKYSCENLPTKQMAVAVQLARFCGLTAKEIIGIRWEWFERHNNGIVISIRYRPAQDDVPAWSSKGDKKNGRVPVSPERLALWRKTLNAEGKESGYLFEFPSPAARCRFIRQETSLWIAQFLPNREKRLHELRKQAGSEVATKHGIFAAAKFLRDTVAVAERHYASLLQDFEPL